MGHEQHGCLHLPPQFHEQILHIEPRGGIESPKWFIHQDHTRPEDQRAGDRHPLPHAPGEFMGVLFGVLDGIEANPGNPVTALGLSLLSRHTPTLEPEDHVVKYRPVVEAGVVLKNHAAIRARTKDVVTKHRDRAAGGRILRCKPCHQPQHRALSAATRAQKRGNLTMVSEVRDCERDILDGHILARRSLTIDLCHCPKLDSRRSADVVAGGGRGHVRRRLLPAAHGRNSGA